MNIDIIEIIGIGAAIVVLVSMCFNANSFRGNMYMRALNFTGSLMYVIYGIYIKSFSVLLLNGVLVFVNLYYIYKALQMKKGGMEALEKRQKEQREHWQAYEEREKNNGAK